MKYQPPVNSPATETDPEPSYFDGNPQAGQKGAIPPAKSIEQPMREILHVITSAGLTPSDSDLTQLAQAIALIAGGVGGDSADFAFNPIYPEILTNGGVCSISASSGQVVLNTGQQWVHRGGVLYNSSDILVGDRTLNTVANKTYHMRWRYNGGSPTLALYDVADVGYNPGSKVEGHADFDSTYDDMLIARVVTNGSNIPTVTALFNKNKLISSGEQVQNPTTWEEDVAPSALLAPEGAVVNINFARRPLAYLTGFTDVTAQRPGSSVAAEELNIVVQTLSRYQIKCVYQRTTQPSGGYVGWAAVA